MDRKGKGTYDVAFERQHLKDHVENTDDGGGGKKIDVGIDEDSFKLFEFAAVSLSCDGSSSGNVSLIRLDRLVDTGVESEFPVVEIVQGDVDWQRLDGIVQFDHVISQLPESVYVENGIVPPVLTRLVSCAGSFQGDVGADGGMHIDVALVAGVGDERHGKIRMIVRGPHRTRRYRLGLLFRGIRRPQ